MYGFYRQYFFIAFLLVVSTPLIAGLVAPETSMIVENEKRLPNELPPWPSSRIELSTIPARLDAYIADRFGLRYEMLRVYANLARRLLRDGNEQVLVGSNDRMFYKLNDSVTQSAGIVRRDKAVAETIALLSDIRDLLESQGIRFLVASPPNSATVYDSDLPHWVRNQGRTTEYDLLVGGLRARGVNVVDLRDPLRQARLNGNLYSLHDTHWTPRGAVVGFNAVAEAAGHSDWKLDVDASLQKPMTRIGGDLARMIGVDLDVTESFQIMSLAAGPQTELPVAHGEPADQRSFWQSGKSGGETLLIIGDSFTRSFFPPLLVNRVGKLAWMHHVKCAVDWTLVQQIHPDEVWWMPTERFFACPENSRPYGFPS